MKKLAGMVDKANAWAEEAEAQLEEERRIKARFQRKPPPPLSDSSNVLTETEQKAEEKHHIRLKPKTQAKAATKRSENAPFGRGSRR